MTLLVDNHQQPLHQVKRAKEEAICFLTIPVKPGLVARLKFVSGSTGLCFKQITQLHGTRFSYSRHLHTKQKI